MDYNNAAAWLFVIGSLIFFSDGIIYLHENGWQIHNFLYAIGSLIFAVGSMLWHFGSIEPPVPKCGVETNSHSISDLFTILVFSS